LTLKKKKRFFTQFSYIFLVNQTEEEGRKRPKRGLGYVPEGVKIVPMRRSGAMGVGEHENRCSEGEAKRGEAKDEYEPVESPELLHRHGGVELRDARVMGGVLAVTEGLRGSHGPSALQGESEERSLLG
jgi:hypothetical protein